MYLLETGAFQEHLAEALTHSEQEVIVLSAFIKHDALEWLVDHCKTKNLRIIARWQPNDLTAGVSDLSCYWLCQKHDIPFGISQQLHGKVYVVDKKIFVGSANLTSRGLSIKDSQNDEFGTGFEYGAGEKSKVQNYLSSVIWLTDDIVNEMSDFLRLSKSNSIDPSLKWPQSIVELLKPQLIGIWVYDLPMCSPAELVDNSASTIAVQHDHHCFGTTTNSNFTELSSGFAKSNIFSWLSSKLRESEELSFGNLSALFHSEVLDDPVPYRKEIKIGIANLFEWAKFVDGQLTVSRPRHTSIIRLGPS